MRNFFLVFNYYKDDGFLDESAAVACLELYGNPEVIAFR